jgi:hypothetical protein
MGLHPLDEPITDELRERLDEVRVSKLAEYLCARLELDHGETVLQLLFHDGRYERMQRFAAVRDQPR